MVDQVEVYPPGRAVPPGARLRARVRTLTRGRLFVAAVGAALALVWAGTAAMVHHRHVVARAEGRAAGVAAARAVVDGTATAFAAANAVMAGISVRAADSRNPDWTTILGDASATAPRGIAFLAVYKTNGRLIHRTGASVGHRETIATLDHFRVPIDRGASGLHIGRPYSDRHTGRTVVPLVLLHPGPGRALRAILVTAIDADSLVARIEEQPGALALARADGTILAAADPATVTSPASSGGLPRPDDASTVNAANGLPLMAISGAVGRDAGTGHAGQLVAAAGIATIGLCAFGMFWRGPRAVRMPAATPHRDDRDVAKAKSVLLATMSHEFRTPLNAVIGFAEVIRDQAAALPPEKLGEYAEDIACSGRQLLQMVNDILDLSQIESGEYEIRPQRIELAETVISVNRIVSPLAAKRQVTLCDPAVAQGLEVTADSRALKQVLYNLVHNAVKFTDAGGTVTVTAVTEPDGMVRLDVIDDGIGIAEADLDRVMHPFEQSRDALTTSSGGTGLGLALVGKLVRLHAGRVSLSSTEGEGTIVSVRLPKNG